MNTKLLLIEGLPGFGKTTTAQLIREILTEKKVNVDLFLEGNLNHPADYDGVAYFTQVEFDELLAMSGEFKQLLLSKAYSKNEGYILPYQKMIEEFDLKLPDNLIQTFYEKDIYELPLEKHMELITNRWREFGQKAQMEDKVYIFECCFIQNPVTIGMIKYNADKQIIIDYVKQLTDSIKDLNPILVYVEQDSLERSFRKAVKERSKQWSEGFIHYYTSQDYGEAHELSGSDGTIQILKDRFELEKEIIESLGFQTIHINNTRYDRLEHKSELTKYLK